MLNRISTLVMLAGFFFLLAFIHNPGRTGQRVYSGLALIPALLETPVLKGFPLFDIDQVEVLKGPQGTLFGRNTTGGAVLLVPNRPKDEFEGYVEHVVATLIPAPQH